MNLSPEAVEILSRNPYVASVTEKSVRFTAEFKAAFWEKYRRGMAAALVLEQMGIDPTRQRRSRCHSPPFLTGVYNFI